MKSAGCCSRRWRRTQRIKRWRLDEEARGEECWVKISGRWNRPRHTCTFVRTSCSTYLVFKVRWMCFWGADSRRPHSRISMQSILFVDIVVYHIVQTVMLEITLWMRVVWKVGALSWSPLFSFVSFIESDLLISSLQYILRLVKHFNTLLKSMCLH